MRSSVDDIKSRLDLLQIVRDYLPLKQAGSSWKGLCPFHSEKSPSFFVSPERGVWHCFGCNEGGDLFSFVMRMEGIEFPEALRLLAEKAGVELRPHDRTLQNVRTRLFDLCRVALEFFRMSLASPSGAAARAYCEKRSLDRETQEAWGIGYAPSSWDALIGFLTTKGFRREEILKSGLVVEKTGGGFYDRFRNRLMFSVHDLQGRVVGFGGRILSGVSGDAKDEPKYVNTPETVLYEKRSILFGLHRAKDAIRETGNAVLVEGYMDVIASHRAGVTTAVATAGTALTPEHVRLLKRYAETVSMSFDMDEAGERAAMRSVDIILGSGLGLRVIELPREPNGRAVVKDPDECIQKLGKTAWTEAVAHAVPFIDYAFRRVLADVDLSRGEEKKRVARVLLTHIARLADPIEQAHEVRKLAETLHISEMILFEQLPKQTSSVPMDTTPPPLLERDRTHSVMERLLSFLLLEPKYISRVTKMVTSTMIEDERHRTVYTTLVVLATRDATFPTLPFPERFTRLKERIPDEESFLHRLVFLREQEGLFSDEVLEEEIDRALRVVKERHVTRELKRIEGAMRDAERARAEEDMQKLIGQFQHLTEELAALHRYVS